MGPIVGAGLIILASVSTFGETVAPSNEIANLRSELKANPKDGELLHQLAQTLYQNKDYDGVTKEVWSHIETAPRKSVILMIKAHEAKKEWHEVVRAAGILTSKKAADEEALTYAGKALFMQRPSKVADAKDHLKRAIEANSKYEPAYDVLGQVYEGNPYEQRLLFQDMVEIFGQRASFLAKLCSLNTADGENEQAEDFCKKAIEKNPRNPQNFVNLGLVAKQKGEPERAKKLLKEAADKFPNSDVAQQEYALMLEKDKNYLESFRYYRKCLDANAQAEQCLLGVGNTGVQVQKYEEAHKAFQKTCQLWKRKHIAQIKKATAVVRQGSSDTWPSKFQELADGCIFQ